MCSTSQIVSLTTAVSEDDQGEDEVAQAEKTHASSDRLLVLLWVLHLCNHGDEGRVTRGRDEDDSGGGKTSEESGRADDGPSEVVGDLGWSSCWTVSDSDGDGQNEDSSVEGDSTNPTWI